MLSKIGVQGGAVGQPHISTPYHGHAPVQVRTNVALCTLTSDPDRRLGNLCEQWVVDHLFSRSFWLDYNRKLHLDIRRRAIRKREREAAKGVKAQ